MDKKILLLILLAIVTAAVVALAFITPHGDVPNYGWRQGAPYTGLHGETSEGAQ